MPSQTSAHAADDVRRGSTTYSFAPFWIPLRRWWNQIGCASRALEPQRNAKSVCSASSYELVEPPAPRIVVRPTTLGACQVRLQLSTLLLPKTARANFDARKFTSFVDFEQLKIPVAVRPCWARLRRNPSAARSRASSQEAGRRTPLSRTKGWVSRGYAPGGFVRFVPLPFTCASPVRPTNSGGCIEGAGCGKWGLATGDWALTTDE